MERAVRRRAGFFGVLPLVLVGALVAQESPGGRGLIGTPVDRIGAASGSDGNIHLFGFASDGHVAQQWYEAGVGWHLADLGYGWSGGVVEPHAGMRAAWSGTGQLHVFTLGAQGDVKQLWFSRGTGWTWAELGNPFAPDRFVGPITVASAGGNSIHVFGLGSSGNVLQMWFDGAWHATDLGNGFAGTRFEGQLSATSLFPGRLDVFGRDSADRLLQLWFDGNWHWSVLGTVLGRPGPSETRSIAATARGAGRLEVFGFDRGGTLLRRSYHHASGWSTQNLGLPFASRSMRGLAATSWGAGRVDLFGLDAAHNVLHMWDEGGGPDYLSYGGVAGYGSSCAPASTPRLGANAPPAIGNPGFALVARGMDPTASVAVALGFVAVDLPLFSCRLLVDPIDAVVMQWQPGGIATLALPIPIDPVMVDNDLFAQAIDVLRLVSSTTVTQGIRVRIGGPTM